MNNMDNGSRNGGANNRNSGAAQGGTHGHPRFANREGEGAKSPSPIPDQPDEKGRYSAFHLMDQPTVLGLISFNLPLACSPKYFKLGALLEKCSVKFIETESREEEGQPVRVNADGLKVTDGGKELRMGWMTWQEVKNLKSQMGKISIRLYVLYNQDQTATTIKAVVNKNHRMKGAKVYDRDFRKWSGEDNVRVAVSAWLNPRPDGSQEFNLVVRPLTVDPRRLPHLTVETKQQFDAGGDPTVSITYIGPER